jgi:hypothetical protein
MLRTSNPPQRHLVFTLDGIRYAKHVYFPEALKLAGFTPGRNPGGFAPFLQKSSCSASCISCARD